MSDIISCLKFINNAEIKANPGFLHHLLSTDCPSPPLSCKKKIPESQIVSEAVFHLFRPTVPLQYWKMNPQPSSRGCQQD